MLQISITDLIQVALLLLLVWASRKWSNPSLRAAIDELRREVGCLRKEVYESGRNSKSNASELKWYKENMAILNGKIDSLIERLRNNNCSAFRIDKEDLNG